MAVTSAALVEQAIAALRQGDQVQAEHLLGQAVQLDPRHPVARHNLAELHYRQGRLEPAQAMFVQLVNDVPDFLPAYPSLLDLLEQRLAAGDAPPEDLRPTLLNNYANVLLGLGRLPEAEQLYRRSLALRPDYANAWSNLSNTLRLRMQLTEAEQAARRALALQPDHVSSLVNLGCALEELACHAEAEACFRRALQLQPDQPQALHNLGSGQLMRQLYRADLSHGELIACHRRWGDAQLAAAPALAPPPPRAGAPRIGFLSSDFRRHAVTSFLEPLLEHLDRGRFDVVCFASQTENDACTERLQRLPLQWQPCHTLDDGALAALIRAEGIDVLIDLNGHTRGTRLGALASKPAPVQASWLGYPFLTGLPTIDYRISDAWVLDGDNQEPKAPEQPLLMDRCQYVYRPLAEAPPVSALPALETEGITFGSRSNLNKLTPAVVALWSQLLHRCPGSRLLLQYSHLTDPQWRGWVRGAFAAHGLPPERLLLIDWDPTLQHLAGYRLIDIALDPFPYNGLTTTCDALWMGVPVVVLRGSVPQARAGVSLLEALGRSTWIADTPEQYLAIAEALAADPLRLSAERSSLRALMAASPLRQEAEHARSFERCLDRMLAEPAGTPPRRRRARSARSAQA